MINPMEDPLLLPSFTEFRISLWKFEKGGELQSLLHMLKYGSLYGLGREIGMELGYRMKRLLFSEGYGQYAGRLVPVPLHPRQIRARGGNQARAIAEGVSWVTGWETVPEGFALRNRYTRSQTGLRREERLENVSGIFDIDHRVIKMTGQAKAGADIGENMGVDMGDSDVVSGPVKRPEGPVIWIVLDDVFTTGATTFELAKTLREGGARHIGIATAATA